MACLSCHQVVTTEERDHQHDSLKAHSSSKCFRAPDHKSLLLKEIDVFGQFDLIIMVKIGGYKCVLPQLS